MEVFKNFTEANWIALAVGLFSVGYNVFNTIYSRRILAKSVSRSRFQDDVKKPIAALCDEIEEFAERIEADRVKMSVGTWQSLDEKDLFDNFALIRRRIERQINDIVILTYRSFQQFNRCDEEFVDKAYEDHGWLLECKDLEARKDRYRQFSRRCDSFRAELKKISQEYESRL